MSDSWLLSFVFVSFVRTLRWLGQRKRLPLVGWSVAHCDANRTWVSQIILTREHNLKTSFSVSKEGLYTPRVHFTYEWENSVENDHYLFFWADFFREKICCFKPIKLQEQIFFLLCRHYCLNHAIPVFSQNMPHKSFLKNQNCARYKTCWPVWARFLSRFLMGNSYRSFSCFLTLTVWKSWMCYPIE